jgi:hypothetical protein
MNTDLFIGFMERQVADSSQKVFLILENLKVHHAKRVMAWLAEREDQIDARDQSRRIPEPRLQYRVAVF